MKKIEFGDGVGITVVVSDTNRFMGIYFTPPGGDVWWYRFIEDDGGYVDSEEEAYRAITKKNSQGVLIP